DPNASRLHMRVERIRSVSNVQDCEVTVSFVDGKPFRKLTRHLLGKVIACCDHDGVGHGENRLTIDMITARILWIAAKKLYFFVDPLPIDGEPLGKIKAAVERQEGPNVTNRIAAAVGSDIAISTKERPERRRMLGNHRDLSKPQRKIDF